MLSVIASVISITVADNVEVAGDCRIEYNKVFNSISSTPEQKCEALRIYSKCLSAFDVNEDLEAPLFSEQSSFCQKYWGKIDSPVIRTKRDNIEMTVNEAQEINFHRHRRETVNVFTMNEQISLLEKQVESLEAHLSENVSALEKKAADDKKSTISTINDANSKMEAALKNANDRIGTVETTVESSKNEIENAMSQLTKDVQANGTLLSKSVDASIAQLTKYVQDSSKALTASVNGKTTELQKSLKGDMDKIKADVTTPKIHMWSGGSRGNSRGHGWTDFVLDRVEYDTAKPYFEKQTNTRFRALQDGLFRARWNYRHYTHDRCWRHGQFIVNGRHVIAPSHQYKYHWDENYMEVTWHIKKNQQFWFAATTSCGNPYRWEGGGSWASTYNRVQVFYMGDLTKSTKCTTNQGLC